jgi:hypothetical protein
MNLRHWNDSRQPALSQTQIDIRLIQKKAVSRVESAYCPQICGTKGTICALGLDGASLCSCAQRDAIFWHL